MYSDFFTPISQSRTAIHMIYNLDELYPSPTLRYFWTGLILCLNLSPKHVQ